MREVLFFCLFIDENGFIPSIYENNILLTF